MAGPRLRPVGNRGGGWTRREVTVGETDLFLKGSLPDLIQINRGDVPLVAAIGNGRLKVDGASKTIRQIRGWFNVDTMART